MAPRLLFIGVMRKSLLACFLILGFASVALADDDPTDSDSGKPAQNDGKPGQNDPSHADPQAKTLPATASATAKANAFGQQGDRMKAAHQAARAAASDEAAKAAADHRPASAGANSHASSHGANSHAASGLAHAAAASHGHAHH